MARMMIVVRSLAAWAVVALAGCVGYGIPGTGYGGYPPGSGYPGSYPPGTGYPGGYPPGSGYGQQVRCESHDNRTQYCSANTRGGVRMTRQLSNARCIQGRSWGYDGRGIWVSNGCRAEFVTGQGGGYNPGYPGNGSQSVRCESQDGRYRRCNTSTRGGVRLSRQLSRTRCVQGSNWGYDTRGIWVSNGCRAEFVVGRGGGYNPGYPGYGSRTVRCESQDGRYRRCSAVVRSGVRIARQLSNTRCVQGRNWGWDRNGVWVNSGCRAEFTVY